MMPRHSVFGSAASGQRLERIQASPRFRDGAFHNTASVTAGLKPGSAMATLGEFVFGDAARNPPMALPTEDPRAAWQVPADTGLRATWLGHSTVLLEIDNVRILTDPVWGLRASPFAWAGPKRFQPAPVAIEALPHLDAVVISHDHYDHLDYPSIVALAKRDVHFYTSLGVGAHLESWGVAPERITELDWWESATLPHADLRITAAPSQHFSGRGLQRNKTLWSSFVLQGPKHRVFFSGDTGPTDEYLAIKDRLGPFDLTMLEVGAWHPSWGDIHLGPTAALKAHAMLGGGVLLPVHWGTFNLALHAWDEPVEALVREATPGEVQLLMPKLGQAVQPSHQEAFAPWWRHLGNAPSHPRPAMGDISQSARPRTT